MLQFDLEIQAPPSQDANSVDISGNAAASSGPCDIAAINNGAPEGPQETAGAYYSYTSSQGYYEYGTGGWFSFPKLSF